MNSQSHTQNVRTAKAARKAMKKAKTNLTAQERREGDEIVNEALHRLAVKHKGTTLRNPDEAIAQEILAVTEEHERRRQETAFTLDDVMQEVTPEEINLVLPKTELLVEREDVLPSLQASFAQEPLQSPVSVVETADQPKETIMSTKPSLFRRAINAVKNAVDRVKTFFSGLFQGAIATMSQQIEESNMSPVRAVLTWMIVFALVYAGAGQLGYYIGFATGSLLGGVFSVPVLMLIALAIALPAGLVLGLYGQAYGFVFLNKAIDLVKRAVRRSLNFSRGLFTPSNTLEMAAA